MGLSDLHPLIRQYVRFDAGPTARVCQDIALRAVHGMVLEEEVEEPSTVVSSAQVTMRAILGLSPHAVAVVRDQVGQQRAGTSGGAYVLWK